MQNASRYARMSDCLCCGSGRVGCCRSGHLHLSQAVQRQEGVPPDLRDAVALGDLAVAQTRGSRLTHESLRVRSEYGNF